MHAPTVFRIDAYRRVTTISAFRAHPQNDALLYPRQHEPCRGPGPI